MPTASKIVPSHAPEMSFHYHYKRDSRDGLWRKLYRIDKPKHRYLDIDYDPTNGKVTALRAPLGKDTTPITLASFIYHQDATEVFDALQHRTIHRINNQKRVTAIEQYTGTGGQTALYASQQFVWGENGAETGHLMAKGLATPQNTFVNYTMATYDNRGNIVKEELFGNFTGKDPDYFTRNGDLRPVHELKIEALYNRRPRQNPPPLPTPQTRPVECYTTEYAYSTDGFNLPLEEHHPDGKHISYRYRPKTNLLIAKLTMGHHGRHTREFHEYDSHGFLTKTLIDDGSGLASHDYTNVTGRKVTYYILSDGPCDRAPSIGFPIEIAEHYYNPATNIELTLSDVFNTYSKQGYLIKQDHYDANGVHRYTLEWEYDLKGNVIQEKNALGHIITRTFDENNNKIDEQLHGSGYITHFTYDFSNRLVQTEEKHENGPTLVTKYSYDLLGNKIAMVDPYGHTTTYTYDEFGRQTSIKHPPCLNKEGNVFTAETKKEYNLLGQVVAETDPMNFTTRTTYTLRGQPTFVLYPDGSQERFEYNLNGTLATKWDKSGLCTLYQYDDQRRLIATDSYDNADNHLQSTRNIYRRGNLIQSIDAMGYTTSYAYDAAGRKIEETKQDSTGLSKTCYEYDALGRLRVTQHWINEIEYTCQIEEFDNLNRVVETRLEDQNQKILSKERYAYDILGNKTHTYVHEDENNHSVTETRYDSQSRPILHIDALGHATSIHYAYIRNANGQVLCKTVTDPLGNQTIDMHDPLGRIVSTECRNAQGQRTSYEEVWFDANGRKVRQKEQVLTPNGLKTDYAIDWLLDSMGRTLSIMEQGGDESPKVTRFEYDTAGRLRTTIKPDGTVLAHSYDAFGRLIEMASSDQTVAYQYSYDANGNVVRVADLRNSTTTLRSYDAWNRLLTEKLANCHSLQFSYDGLGRPTRITLPDSSSIRYTYDSANLVTISRYDAADTLLYQHTYSKYDLKGQAREMQLIGNAGKIDLSWDALGRRVALKHPRWSEQIPTDGFDAAGNLIQLITTDLLGEARCTYQYDDLYQLTQEDGPVTHTYAYDSIRNRLKKDWLDYVVNGLNQVTSDSDLTYGYDANGNLISKCGPGVDRNYTYDALNRLVAAEEIGHWRINYLHDSFGRRLGKTISLWKDGWVEESTTTFVYQNQREVGAFENGLCTQLRVLGTGKGAELGAAIAVELAGNVYAPLHDHRGNVCCLLEATSGQTVEFYRYSAYGEVQIYNATLAMLPNSPLGNPWLFASKRLDPHTKLIQFGKRDYDCHLGRWLTPDPIGFADGPNLYVYVQNNPLILYDPWGLAVEYTTNRLSWEECKAGGSGCLQGMAHPINTGSRFLNYGYHLGSAIWNRDFSKISDKWNSLGQDGQRCFIAERMGEVAGLATWVNPFRMAAGVGMYAGGKVLQLGSRMMLRSKVAATGAETLVTQGGSSSVSTAGIRAAEETLAFASVKPSLTRTSIKQYLNGAENLSYEQITRDLEAVGLKLGGKSPDSRFMKFLDKQGTLRVKIHPADKTTPYSHLHIYDRSGRSLNSNLQVVDKRSLEAHIQIKDIVFGEL